MFKSVQKAVYSVRNKPVCEFKNWCVTTLLQGYVIYPIQSKKPEQVRRRDVTSSVQSLKLADLKSAANEPPRNSRKQKLDK